MMICGRTERNATRPRSGRRRAWWPPDGSHDVVLSVDPARSIPRRYASRRGGLEPETPAGPERSGGAGSSPACLEGDACHTVSINRRGVASARTDGSSRREVGSASTRTDASWCALVPVRGDAARRHRSRAVPGGAVARRERRRGGSSAMPTQSIEPSAVVAYQMHDAADIRGRRDCDAFAIEAMRSRRGARE